MLTKEQGIAVLAVCAIYDAFIYNRVKLLDIIKLHILTMVSRRKLKGIIIAMLLKHLSDIRSAWDRSLLVCHCFFKNKNRTDIHNYNH